MPITSPQSIDVPVHLRDGTFQDAQNYAAGPYPSSVAVGNFNGDGFPDLAVANYYSGTVTVLLNAADWGGSPAPAPPLRPALHLTAQRQPQMELVDALVAAFKPQAEHALPLTFTDLPPITTRQWLLETETGQPARPEATFTPTPIVTSRHAQDAVFERLSDSIVDALALDWMR